MKEDHALAVLLANVVDEWCRYYGADDAQARHMLTILLHGLERYPVAGR